MNYISKNIRFLRKVKGMTQQQLANELQIKRSVVGAYEEERASPKIQVLQQLASFFEVTIEQLISCDLEISGLSVADNRHATNPSVTAEKPDRAGSPVAAEKLLRILPIVVDKNNEELIPIVPVKASAGYLNGFADPQFIGSLPVFSMPVPELAKGRSHRVFQIKGDSMLPMTSGSYLFCEYVESISGLKEGEIYILITRDEGLVCKRVYLNGGTRLTLKSDNPEYEPYVIDRDDVMEIWKTKGVLSFEMPKPERGEISHISKVLAEMKEEIRKLREQSTPS